MILVDVKPESTQKDPVVEAINSLVKTTEFSKANFGSNAIVIGHLDTELKELLAREDLPADARVREYNQRLQKYLFLLRESEKGNLRPNPVGVPIPTVPQLEFKEEEVGTGSNKFEDRSYDSDGSAAQGTSHTAPPFNAAVDNTPKTSKPFQQPTISPPLPAQQKTTKYRSNLPRETPIHDRLRKTNDRRKNSRYEEYYINWTPYSGK